MKHVIAFLGHQQSRIQNPVYLRFANTPFARRNTALIFTSRLLDEREVNHELNELRRRSESIDQELCFHLCADLTQPAAGQQLIQSVLLIQKLYRQPAHLYCRLPELEHCTPEQRNTAWKGLTAINNCINDYPKLRLIAHCWLYNDPSQQALAHLLHTLTTQRDVMDEVERQGYEAKPKKASKKGDRSFAPDFPKVFATFDATMIRYPEEEVQYYLHQSYIEALLELTRPSTNPIDLSLCNEHVNAMMSHLPLTTGGVTQTEGTFIDLNPDEPQQTWPDTEEYWQQSLRKAIAELHDMPHDEWLTRMRLRMQQDYTSHYRKAGVEAYYDAQCQLTPRYREVMHAQLQQDLHGIMRRYPYPPETSQDIVRALVNRLQVLEMKMSEQQDKLCGELKEMDCELARLTTQWETMGFFDRLRGKDKELMATYQPRLKEYYLKQTLRRGLDFGCKLLNELIPQVVALPNEENHLGAICQGALDNVKHGLADHQPKDFMPDVFDTTPVSQAVQSIRADRTRLQQDYDTVRDLLYPTTDAALELNSESFLLQLRDRLDEQIDAYIGQRIDKGTMPLVLSLDVMQRLEAAFADRGGLPALISEMEKETAFSLALKGEGGTKEQYLLISPACEGLTCENHRSEDASSVTMLHLLTGISLTDLDGFAGQRMFVEPSMF